MIKKKVASYYKDAVGVVDAGLRTYMLRVFSYMSGGLALTALVAYFVSSSPSLMAFLFYNPFVFAIITLAPLGISIYLVTQLAHISKETAQMLFLTYSTCLGMSLASIFIVYSGSSITSTFFVTSSMFLSMTIYGYVTDKDLTSWGSFLTMGLFGIIIASIINIFTHSSAFTFGISLLGVLIFTGLTAYDIQIIKSYYFESDNVEVSEKKAIYGALRLYLDFINLFLSLLRLVGSRRD
ncbi:MAG: Bax inhibitor-1/YccA family protein [Holosporaceae bacterium]|jgi:FtsH-binding integral membrane protein|nr:Bax inhibitor-1/YccA family protein [Holosporaceae bacterium]